MKAAICEQQQLLLSETRGLSTERRVTGTLRALNGNCQSTKPEYVIICYAHLCIDPMAAINKHSVGIIDTINPDFARYNSMLPFRW